MKRFLQHSVLVCLLLSYIVVGVLGNLHAFSMLWHSARTLIITKSKTGPPKTVKVYWTQHKHIPVTVKVSVPSAAIAQAPELHRCKVYRLLATVDIFSLHADPAVYLNISRAPPLS